MMARLSIRYVVGFALLAAVASRIFTALRPSSDESDLPNYVQGKNNTALFFVNSNYGFSNAHLATAHALLEKHPDVKLHFATFDKLEPKLRRVEARVRATSPAAQPVSLHLLRGRDYLAALEATGFIGDDNMSFKTGLEGHRHFTENVRFLLSPWTDEEHLEIYHQCVEIIKDVDPAMVVLDPMFKPAIEATQELRRLYAVVSPNAFEAFSQDQGLAFLTKFPATGTGFEYPLPWSKVPANVLSTFRLIYRILSDPDTAKSRVFLKSKGIADPLNFFKPHRVDRPWITQGMREAAMPVHYLPPNVTTAGPMVLSLAPAAEQDPELAGWMKKAPTLLVNMGSIFKYDEPRALAMASAIEAVLAGSGVQVLWKFRKDRKEYGDEFKVPLQKYIDQGRLRMVDWLTVDPGSLLETGDIIASVHHGGSNCYHETLSAGVPHVILPVWVDCYDYAVYGQYHGIGVYANQKTAPEWGVEGLTEAFLKVVGDSEESLAMREKARKLGEIIRAKPGREEAARQIAQLAATGV